MEPVPLIARIRDSVAGSARAKDLEALHELVRKGEVRDATFTPELYEAFFGLLSAAFTWRAKDVQADVVHAELAFLGATKVPEFEPSACERLVEDHLLRALYGRCDGSATQEEWPCIRDLFLFFYGHFPQKRGQIRSLVGRALRSAGSFAHKSAPVTPLLEVLAPVIRGFQAPLMSVHKSLLLDVLMPLHKTNEWLQWDRQSPLISMYHPQLVRCVLQLLEKQRSLAPKCLELLCACFPTFREANTPKEVLIIYEVSQVLRYVEESAFPQVLPNLLQHMVRLLGSHNSQPVQSVLQFWKDGYIEKLFQGASAHVVPAILPALLCGGEPSWNPTVNRMTSLVLEKLEAGNPEVFRETAEEIWGPGRRVPAYIAAQAAAEAAIKEAAEESDGGAPRPPGGSAQSANVGSLKYCLGGWKPPGAGGGGSGGKPPVTATGVAPWAMGGGSAGGKQPPLTATGVAPWAFNKSSGAPPRPGPLSAVGGSIAGGLGSSPKAIPERGSLGGLGPCREDAVEKFEKSGLERVRDYVKVLCPTGPATDAGAAQPWETALTADTPTLLPSLKFHQLVFGAEDIASGAFSVVRYARTIIKEKTQSQWPEYAVKVINTKTIQEHGYEASLNREICVLKMLSHPGIARMVSAFRYREGAYLVLEYASKGDLHTILVQQGPLPEATARFFIGEVVAALCAIHEAGFVYSDLKPENIVVTSTCHAKLTDFGGCRPLTGEARERTKLSLLRRLRDGDWRAKEGPDSDSRAEESAELDEADALAAADDNRVEGTMLYLPPEVIHGGLPTLAADAWALGCTTYQLLSGKPPIWVDSELEDDLRHRIVHFKVDEGHTSMEAVPESSRDLISKLMQSDVGARLSVQGAAEHPFFQGESVFRLHARPRGPEVAGAQRRAAKAEEGDERWQKRQFSKIWSVQPSPQDYAMPSNGRAAGASAPGAAAADFSETDAERGEPFLDESLMDLPGIASRIESL